MGIKASIVIPAYEKNKELPNVFYSISQQKACFDWEVCFMDDCSYEDPRPIYDEFLQVKHKKGMRLKQHVGTRGAAHAFKIHRRWRNAFQWALSMVDPETEVVVLQSGDVLWTSSDMLQKMVTSMAEDKLLVPTVLNIAVPPDLYKDFDVGVQKLLLKDRKGWYYQGSGRPRGQGVAAFLLPVDYRWLIDKVRYQADAGEFQIGARATYDKMEYTYRDDIVGIHQLHGNHPSVSVTKDENLVNWSDNIDIHPERVYYETSD